MKSSIGLPFAQEAGNPKGMHATRLDKGVGEDCHMIFSVKNPALFFAKTGYGFYVKDKTSIWMELIARHPQGSSEIGNRGEVIEAVKQAGYYVELGAQSQPPDIR